MIKKRITPMDYEYDKYFLINATLLRSSLSNFFFFDGEEAFEREFGKYQEVVEDIKKRATQLKEEYKKKKGDGMTEKQWIAIKYFFAGWCCCYCLRLIIDSIGGI